jgi:ribonuclease BN (tRNA processing enzyme)
MPSPIELTFLGTGNFNATAGYWNSFLIDRRILVETSPIVLRHLQLVGTALGDVDVIFISHFHADHTFGWPFFYYSALSRAKRTNDLWVVGPPGIERFLNEMLHAGRLTHVVENARKRPDAFNVQYVEVDEQPQSAGGVQFRAVRVDHDPTLECFGYLIEVGGRTIGYSGDTTLCPGLREIAKAADALVLECNVSHHVSEFTVHMSFDDVRMLRSEFPNLPFVLTHRAPDVDGDDLPGVTVPSDLDTVTV